MKIVLDTNVLLSGLITTTGVSQYVLSRALRRHQVILSEYIMDELKRNLIRKFNVSEKRVSKVIHFLRQRSKILRVPNLSKINFSDKSDGPILSLVETAMPHYFITGDKQLQALKKLGTTLILNPREALEVL